MKKLSLLAALAAITMLANNAFAGTILIDNTTNNGSFETAILNDPPTGYTVAGVEFNGVREDFGSADGTRAFVSNANVVFASGDLAFDISNGTIFNYAISVRNGSNTIGSLVDLEARLVFDDGNGEVTLGVSTLDDIATTGRLTDPFVTLSGSASFNASGTVRFEIANENTDENDATTAQAVYDSLSLEQQVPEPTTLGLGFLSMLGLVSARRR